MFIDMSCKKCGASLELTKYRANNRTSYALVHSKDYPFEKECEFSEMVISVKLKESD